MSPFSINQPLLNLLSQQTKTKQPSPRQSNTSPPHLPTTSNLNLKRTFKLVQHIRPFNKVHTKLRRPNFMHQNKLHIEPQNPSSSRQKSNSKSKDEPKRLPQMSVTQSIKMVQPILSSQIGFKHSYLNKEVSKTSESPRPQISYVQWQNPITQSSNINQSHSSISIGKFRESCQKDLIQIDQNNSFDRGVMGISELKQAGKKKEVEVLFYHQVKEFKRYLNQVEQI